MFSGISSYIWGSGGERASVEERAVSASVEERAVSASVEERALSPEVEERAVAAECGNGDEWILIDVQEKGSGSSSRKQRKSQMKKVVRNKVVPDTPILVPNLRFISSSEKRQKKLKSSRKTFIPKSMTQGEGTEVEIPSLPTLPLSTGSSSDAPMSTTTSSSSSDTDDRPSYAAMAKVVASSSVGEEDKEGKGSKVEQVKPFPMIVVKPDPERRTKGKKSSKDKDNGNDNGSGLMEEGRTKGKKSSKDKGNGLMEGSWFLTPPPCFTKPNTFSLAASPEEDSLIEHPSVVTSITAASFSHGDHGPEMSNPSTPLVSSPQDSPMVVSASSSLNNSPPASPMIINRSPGLRESKDRKIESLGRSDLKIESLERSDLKIENLGRVSEDRKLRDGKPEVGPETVAEKGSVGQADIRALARRTLDLRSSNRSGNRFAKLEAEDHFYPGFFSLAPSSSSSSSSSSGQMIKSHSFDVGKPLSLSPADSMSTEVFYGPENKPDDENGQSMDKPDDENGQSMDKADDENGQSMDKADDGNGQPMDKADDYDDENGQSIDTTESLDSDHDDLDSLVDDHSRPILAENLSALNIVSRMERKGRTKRKGAKGRKGKQQQEGKENSAEDGEGDVGKRNSSSERAHAALLAQTRARAYEPVVQESLRQAARIGPYLKGSFLDRSNKVLRSLNRHPTRRSKVAAMHNNYSCNRKVNRNC